MIGKTVSHYKILEKIGEGGMGKVYKAEDTRLKRFVAMKFLHSKPLQDDEEMIRFTQEAQSAARLDHPNICTVYEIGDLEGRPFITMAYIDGPTLREKVASGPLSVEETIDLAIQICKGLNEAHEAGIVHRDIKSANIMLTSRGQVKVMDFGVAKVLEGPRLTKVGSTIGTAAYMSPEQVRGEEVDHRSDIWAVGVLIYLMLTGKLPFEGTWYVIMKEILEENPLPASQLNASVPGDLQEVIDKCIVKDREQRYQSLNEVTTDLMRVWRRLGAENTSPGNGYGAAASQTQTVFAQRPTESTTAQSAVSADAAPSVEAAPSESSSSKKPIIPIVIGILVLLLAAVGISMWMSGNGDSLDAADSVVEGSTPANVPQQTSTGIDFRPIAEKARENMERARTDARAIRANTLATSQFGRAAQLQQEAESAFTNEDFHAAESLFTEAAKEYTRAQTAAELNATQTASTPPKETKRDETPKIDPYKSRADQARNSMNSARSGAIGADAENTTEFANASSKESAAKSAYRQGNYQSAAKLYGDAASLYSASISTANEAVSANQALHDEASTAYEAVQTVKARMDNSYHYLSAYISAEAAEQKGEVSRIGGNNSDAISHYEDATKLYEDALSQREEQVADVTTLINGYASALESKNMDALSILQTSQFATENDKRWGQFFKVAKDLQVNTKITEITFEQGRATGWVEVQLDFRGARGGAEWNTWQMDFVDQNGKWLVANH